ncbi:MAG: coaE 1 [Gammaproteobacteria bacterium]|jgi:dephospho-CoA kinase|nr:coaE 1 [Gammaproteobacteria bacterium]
MFTIGLTGGIGSGKSTVADLFKKKGITIIDADHIAHDLTQPGQICFNKIVEIFGKSILLSNKNLDRAQLRRIIFADPAKRQWLEQLLHPLIRAEMQRLILNADSPYCIAVIPLLLETAPNPIIQRILVIDAPEEQQIARCMTRDHLSEKEIKAIMQTQVTRKQRLAAADDIIHNHNTFAELLPQVEKLHHFYLLVKNNF